MTLYYLMDIWCIINFEVISYKIKVTTIIQKIITLYLKANLINFIKLIIIKHLCSHHSKIIN